MGNRITRRGAGLKTRLVSLFLVSTAFLFTGCKSSSSSNNADSVGVTLSASALSVPWNGSLQITATGGTGTYTAGSASIGTITQTSNGIFTYVASGSGAATTAVITVTDSNNNVGTINISVGSGSASGLTITPSTGSTIMSPSTSQTLTVTGGSGSYTWSTTGGQISSYTGSTVTFIAPASTGSTVIITVNDSLTSGLSGTLTLTIGTSTGVSGNCAGVWNVIFPGSSASATISLLQDAYGTIAGNLTASNGYVYALAGTCSSSGISFNLYDTSNGTPGTLFTGQFYTSSGQVSSYSVIFGSYVSSSDHHTYQWQATHQ